MHMILQKHVFIGKSCSSPAWEEIKPDHFIDMPFVLLIVPGAYIPFREPSATYIFTEEYANGIYNAPDYEMKWF